MNEQTPTTYRSDGSHLEVDSVYWQRLAERDPQAVCNATLFEPAGEAILEFPFLNERRRVDIGRRCLLSPEDDRWLPAADPLLEMVTVIYLAHADRRYPVGQDIVGVNDLKEWHFFVGPHALKLDPLIRRFGTDLAGFRRAAERLEGHPEDMADAAYRLMPFPRVPIYYLLWEGDAEFSPEVRVLLDRPIESVLQADAIWALINRVTQALAEA